MVRAALSLPALNGGACRAPGHGDTTSIAGAPSVVLAIYRRAAGLVQQFLDPRLKFVLRPAVGLIGGFRALHSAHLLSDIVL